MSEVYHDKPTCPHHWHQKDLTCGETGKTLDKISERKCCICKAEQFVVKA